MKGREGVQVGGWERGRMRGAGGVSDAGGKEC